MRKLWFIFSLTIFFIIVIIFFPFYILVFIILGKRAIRPLIWCSHKVVARLGLWGMLIRMRVHGREHIDNQQPYVMVANHQAAVDILIYAVVTPFLFKFLSKKEVGNIPLFGYVASRISVFVDRKSAASRRESFERIRAALGEGFSVFLAPEGTRTQADELLSKFYSGAFRLAIETQTPLLVLTLANPRELNNPLKKMDMSPGVVDCYFDPPIETKGMTLEDVPELEKRVREIMLKYLS